MILANDVRLKIFANAFSFMRKPLLSERVRYPKKLAEKCSVALKSVMFMNDFDNFNKKCSG